MKTSNTLNPGYIVRVSLFENSFTALTSFTHAGFSLFRIKSVLHCLHRAAAGLFADQPAPGLALVPGSSLDLNDAGYSHRVVWLVTAYLYQFRFYLYH